MAMNGEGNQSVALEGKALTHVNVVSAVAYGVYHPCLLNKTSQITLANERNVATISGVMLQ